jgi:hypothetical protein
MRKPAVFSRLPRRPRGGGSAVRGAITIGASALAVSVAVPPAGAMAPSSVTVTALQTENLTNPVGIDAVTPVLGWQDEDHRAGTSVAQVAYQVRAATSLDRLNKGGMRDVPGQDVVFRCAPWL